MKTKRGAEEMAVIRTRGISKLFWNILSSIEKAAAWVSAEVIWMRYEPVCTVESQHRSEFRGSSQQRRQSETRLMQTR